MQFELFNPDQDAKYVLIDAEGSIFFCGSDGFCFVVASISLWLLFCVRKLMVNLVKLVYLNIQIEVAFKQ